MRVVPAVEERLDAVSQQLGQCGSVHIREAIALAQDDILMITIPVTIVEATVLQLEQ